MGWLSLTDLRCWICRRGGNFALADPTSDIAFLKLDAGFVHRGSRLDFADFDALLVLAADAGFRELRGCAVEQDGDELPVDLVGACEAEIVREDGAGGGVGRWQILGGEDGTLPKRGVVIERRVDDRRVRCMSRQR